MTDLAGFYQITFISNRVTKRRRKAIKGLGSIPRICFCELGENKEGG
jgi:hypothetical protein